MAATIKTWILLANGTEARILLNDGVGHGVKPVAGAVFARAPLRDQDVYSDRPGRVYESADTARHSAERKTSADDHDRQVFAGKIAAYLAKSARMGAFARLALVVEPSMLGLLRAEMAPEVKKLVTVEIDKDLTRTEKPELLKVLSAHMAV